MQIPTIEEIRTYLKEKDHFLILMHTKPDGDALGSAYGLLKFLLKTGKKAIIGIEEEMFYKYQSFFPQEDRKLYFQEYNHLKKDDFENIIVVDTSSFSLLGVFTNWVVNHLDKVLFLDHHIVGASLEPASHYIRHVSSTCEIMLELVPYEYIDLDMARALYMGVVFDTGQFRHSGANYSIFYKVAKLLESFDINKEDTYYYLFENETLERKKLEGSLSNRIRLFAKGNIAVCYLTLELVQELSTAGVFLSEDDMIDLTGVPHSLKGVKVSVMMREKADQISISFRSRCEFNVAEFAASFGGGGHKKAAGLKLPHMTEEEVTNTVLIPLQEAFLEWATTNITEF